MLLHFRIVSHMESSVFERDEDLMVSMMSYFRMMMTENALELNDAVSTFKFWLIWLTFYYNRLKCK